MDVDAEVLIERSREEVARFAMDPRNDTRWIANIKEARPLDDVKGRGARVARTASFLGRRVEYVLEVVEHDPPGRVVMSSVAGPFPMRVTYEFEERGPDRTLARIRLGGDATGFFRLAAPLLRSLSRRNIRRDLRVLKRVMERR